MSILNKLQRWSGARPSLDVPSADSGPEALREAILEHGLDAARAFALGNALERCGRRLEAIEVLTLANRMRRDPVLERRLVRLRQASFADVDRSLPSPSWPPFVPEDAPGAQGPPIVKPGDLSPGLLRRGILRHGCVLVRGLVPPARVDRLVRAIDRAFDAHDAWAASGGQTSADFDPLEAIPNGIELRGWIRQGLGVLACDSPSAFHEYLETVYELGIDRLIAGHLGERPALSAEKCTLRRVDSSPSGAYWHQDGAFMGDGIRTVNAWFALSRCGVDAPGLDMIPLRFEQLLPRGEEGVLLDWAVSRKTIDRELPGVQIWRPEFEAGDVLFFDHMFLHRTAAEPDMPRMRYAIESWYFAASVYPEGSSTPLVI
jgi:hypothetical protein